MAILADNIDTNGIETKKNYVVLGIFHSRADVERAIISLEENGFRNSDVSALMPSPATHKEFAHEGASKAPEGAAAGMTAGALVGGTLGWLAGVGALAIPGLGPLIAAGPIVAALAGVGAGGAVGGLTGGLIGLGIPEYNAKRYEGQVKKGGILFSVHCDNAEWCERAEDILESCGATDISSTTEARTDREEGTYISPTV